MKQGDSGSFCNSNVPLRTHNHMCYFLSRAKRKPVGTPAYLGFKEVLFVEEEDKGLVPEPLIIHDVLKQAQALLHPVGGRVFQ